MKSNVARIGKSTPSLSFLSWPMRLASKAFALYHAPPFHRIVRNPAAYLLWRAGLMGHGSKTFLLRSGEQLVMRYPPACDWFTAAEVFVEREYNAPFPIPSGIQQINDLGGNVGYATIFLAKCFPQSHIDVFEPHPEHLRQLNLHIELNSLSTRTTVHPYAAGARCGSMFLSDADTQSTVMEEEVKGSIGVRVIDWLDFATHRKIDFLKMDIEGGEYAIVFDPRFKSLRIPYICMEWHMPVGTKRPSITAELIGMGYTVHAGPEKRLPDLRYGMIWARLS